MADFVIRGMGMPKTCGDCPLSALRMDCKLTGRDISHDWIKRKIPDWCPLVPLPEGHGRLIDADALDRAFTDLRFNSDGTLNHWGDRPGWCMHGYEVEKLIADAPTIVPAEGGGEDGQR